MAVARGFFSVFVRGASYIRIGGYGGVVVWCMCRGVLFHLCIIAVGSGCAGGGVWLRILVRCNSLLHSLCAL